jgi:branched-chain amino acid transport system substrate-binding protein
MQGWIRKDGRVTRSMYLFQGKSPAEFKYKFDDYKFVAKYPAEKTFRPLPANVRPLVSGKAPQSRRTSS